MSYLRNGGDRVGMARLSVAALAAAGDLLSHTPVIAADPTAAAIHLPRTGMADANALVAMKSIEAAEANDRAVPRR